MLCHTASRIAMLLVFTLVLAADARAVLLSTLSTDLTSQTFYPVSNTDLIDISQAGVSLASSSHGAYTSFGGSSAANLNDGSVGVASSVPTVAFSAGAGAVPVPWTSTYIFDTSINDLGYTITGIDTFSGWSASRSGQAYTIRYTTVDNATPQILGSFSIADPGTGSTRIEIFDDTGTILTGVKSLLFDVTNANNVYREFDVIGFAVPPVPEPSSILLMGFGLIIGHVVRSRRRSKQKGQ